MASISLLLTDFSLLFPDDYVNNISERLRLYTTLNDLKTDAELKTFEAEVIDRFGPLPTEVVDLFEQVLALRAGPIWPASSTKHEEDF